MNPMDNARISTEEILLTIDSDTGAAPESRLKDAHSLREIWENLNRSDEVGAYNRSVVRSLINGHPPFDQAEREEEGTGDLFNVNTGTGRLITDESTSGMMDIFSSERNLVEIPLDTRIPDNMRFGFQKLIEDEFSKMLTEWDAFAPRVNNLCNTDVIDGVGFLFFENDDTWQFNCCGLKDFKVNRDSEPVSTRIPVAILRREMYVGDLYRKIRNEKEAAEKGWDVEAVRGAILKAARRHRSDIWRDWERLESDLKNNELYVSNESAPVEVLIAFIQEFDGSVSMSIGTASSGTADRMSRKEDSTDRFLYRRPKNYKDANEVFQVFPYSSGDDNKLYSVRGMGHFIYQACNAKNIMFSRMMDAARIGSTTTYQPRSMEDLEEATFLDFGYGMVVPPGFSIPERAQAPNLSQTLVPAMETIDKSLNEVSGLLKEGPQAMGERANEQVISFSLEQINKMSAFAVTLFYPPLDRAYREVVRRIFIEDKDTRESEAMKERLEKLGVTEEIWRRIDLPRVRARRLIGGANKAGRMFLLNQQLSLLSGMDDQGRRELYYDITAERFGKEYAVRYHGDPSRSRKVVDEKLADLENFHMIEGNEIEVHDGEDHMAHLRSHLEEMIAGREGIDQGLVDLGDYYLRFIKIFEHAQAHLALMVPDESTKEEIAAFRQALQNLDELFTNGEREILAEQRKAAQQNGGAQQEGQQPLSEVEIQLREEQRKDLAAQADIERKNRESAAKIARERVEADVKIAERLRSSK